MSDMVMQMMNSFAHSFGDSTSKQNSFDIFDEAELKSQAAEMGKGVKYVSGEKVKVNVKEGYKAFYSFENINDLKLSDSPDEKVPVEDMPMTEEAEKPQFITFSFKEGSPSNLEIVFPEDDEEDDAVKETVDSPEYEGNAENADMMAEQMKMLFRDFRVSMKMQLDGDIKETNATHVDNNVITFFEMDFAKLMDMPEKFDKLKSQEPSSMSEIKSLVKDVPGFKIEMNKKVFVEFD